MSWEISLILKNLKLSLKSKLFFASSNHEIPNYLAKQTNSASYDMYIESTCINLIVSIIECLSLENEYDWCLSVFQGTNLLHKPVQFIDDNEIVSAILARKYFRYTIIPNISDFVHQRYLDLEKLQVETPLLLFGTRFLRFGITSVPNFVSMGEPCLAHHFDELMARISSGSI